MLPFPIAIPFVAFFTPVFAHDTPAYLPKHEQLAMLRNFASNLQPADPSAEVRFAVINSNEFAYVH